MVSLIDGKLKLTPSALGELLQHLQWLTAGLGPSAVAHGMLCAREEFYLVTAGASPVRIIQGRWTAAGTAAAVQNFMGAEQKWEQAVRSACSQLRLLPVRALGRGLHGLVVEAADEKDERWALKVRLDLGFPSLEQEYIALRDCVSRGVACLPNNVSPFLAVCGTGQAYAMQPVGLGIQNSSAAEHFIGAYHALRRLHEAAVFHGDPRPANLLLRATPVRHSTRAGRGDRHRLVADREVTRLSLRARLFVADSAPPYARAGELLLGGYAH